jgi:hypothetical protein
MVAEAESEAGITGTKKLMRKQRAADVMIPAGALGTRNKSEGPIPLSKLLNRELNQFIPFNTLDSATEAAVLEEALRRGLLRNRIPVRAIDKIESICTSVLSRAKSDEHLQEEAEAALASIREWRHPPQQSATPRPRWHWPVGQLPQALVQPAKRHVCEPGGAVPKFRSKGEMKAYIKNRISNPEA